MNNLNGEWRMANGEVAEAAEHGAWSMEHEVGERSSPHHTSYFILHTSAKRSEVYHG